MTSAESSGENAMTPPFAGLRHNHMNLFEKDVVGAEGNPPTRH